MNRSTYLAKLIGPVFVAGGLGMLFNTAVYRAMFDHALHDHILIYLSGVIALVAGLAIVAAHNEWKWHWSLIITLLGWCAIIGGAVRMIAPQVIASFGMSILSYPSFFMIDGAVAVLLGLLLSYFGYADMLTGGTGSRASRKRRR